MAVLFLIFLDQICPKWIKLDQIGFLHQSKNVTIKKCRIYRKDKYGWVSEWGYRFCVVDWIFLAF